MAVGDGYSAKFWDRANNNYLALSSLFAVVSVYSHGLDYLKEWICCDKSGRCG